MTKPEIDKNGNKEWRWLNEKGEFHRIDGPAYIYPDGRQEWYLNSKIHRLDGPAVIFPNGSQKWYINDIDITEEINEWLSQMNITYPFTDEEKVLFAVRWL